MNNIVGFCQNGVWVCWPLSCSCLPLFAGSYHALWDHITKVIVPFFLLYTSVTREIGNECALDFLYRWSQLWMYFPYIFHKVGVLSQPILGIVCFSVVLPWSLWALSAGNQIWPQPTFTSFSIWYSFLVPILGICTLIRITKGLISASFLIRASWQADILMESLPGYPKQSTTTGYDHFPLLPDLLVCWFVGMKAFFWSKCLIGHPRYQPFRWVSCSLVFRSSPCILSAWSFVPVFSWFLIAFVKMFCSSLRYHISWAIPKPCPALDALMPLDLFVGKIAFSHLGYYRQFKA